MHDPSSDSNSTHNMRPTILRFLLGCAVLLPACSRTSTGVPTQPSELATVLAISPANAAVGTDPAKPVVITFSHAMMAGMETLVMLHEGPVTGPPVAGVATWSADRTILTFTPSAPLKARTAYTLHLAPSLRSADGRQVDLAGCSRLGGQYATAGMMGIASGGGMMNGSWGPGMMGETWRAADGTFGMIFTFTTA